MSLSIVPALRDLAGAYVLHALSDDERVEFEELLARDEDLRAEVTQLADTAAMLGAAVPPVVPPAGLRSRLIALAEVLPAPERPMRPVVALRPAAPSSRFPRRRTLGLLASAAAVVALVAGGVGLLGATDPSGPGLDRIRAASDVHTVRGHVTGGGTAEVVWSPHAGRAAVTVDDLPALSGDRVYQLWYIDGTGIATKAGVAHAGDDPSTIVLDGRLPAGDSIGMTVEQRGATAPTTVPILSVDTV